MASKDNSSTGTTGKGGFSVAAMLRSFGERSEADKPFEPFVGGPRLFTLILYATVLVAASLEFFASQNIWYGSWEVYNTYVFVASGIFVFLGMVMLFTQVHDAASEWSLPISRPMLGGIGLALLVVSGIVLVLWGKGVGTWAILLSVTLLYGFLMVLLASKAFGMRESAKLFVYGTGLVVMILVPVHEAFNVARSAPGDYPFTLLNLILLTTGMTLSLASVQSLQTRDGYIGAWLLGAMAIFLVAFHEQVGIVESDTYSLYDRALALIGITFSFLPLVMYAWRERIYFFLWRRLKNANDMIERGDYDTALVQTEVAIRQCAKVGIDDRFALPWSLKGDALYRKKQYQKAAVAYDAALTIDPNDSASWCNLGNIHALDGKHEEALKAFDRAIKADPYNGFAWNNKGAIFQKMDKFEDAIICFDKAARLMPDAFDPHINMAKLLSKMEKSQEALIHYQAALALRPGSEVAREGVQKEHFRSMCLDQIAGWEQLGLDTSYLKLLLEQDPKNFVRKSKEFLASIVDQQTQLQVVPSKEHLDINGAMKKILQLTEPPGASLERLKEETRMRERDLVLPIALLMETERVHFRMIDGKQVYVSKGKAPDRPTIPPTPPPSAPPPKPKAQERPMREQPLRSERLPMPPPMLPPAKLTAPYARPPEPAPVRPPQPVAEKPIQPPPPVPIVSKRPEVTPEPPRPKPSLLEIPPEPMEAKRPLKRPPKPIEKAAEKKPKAKPEVEPKPPEKKKSKKEEAAKKKEAKEEPEEKPEKKAPPKKPKKEKSLRDMIRREVVKVEPTASILVFKRKK